jgi:serine/threonine protein kinase
VISQSGWLSLFRACSVNDANGPGCYVIKTVSASCTQERIALSLLQREATVTRDVSHPHLSAVLASHTAADRPHLTLPYLEGVSLRRLLAAHPSRTPSMLLPVAAALSLARQVSAALAAMDESGWLHGQVRPEHIIVSPQGHVTLIDLTLARRLETRECEVDGSHCEAPVYAAPESFTTRPLLTPASDVYSLGITLYEALTGRPPFLATDPRRLALCHRREAPVDLRQLRPTISRETSELVRRTLYKEPLRRPSAAELVRWLTELEIEELCS